MKCTAETGLTWLSVCELRTFELDVSEQTAASVSHFIFSEVVQTEISARILKRIDLISQHMDFSSVLQLPFHLRDKTRVK